MWRKRLHISGSDSCNLNLKQQQSAPQTSVQESVGTAEHYSEISSHWNTVHEGLWEVVVELSEVSQHRKNIHHYSAHFHNKNGQNAPINWWCHKKMFFFFLRPKQWVYSKNIILKTFYNPQNVFWYFNNDKMLRRGCI